MMSGMFGINLEMGLVLLSSNGATFVSMGCEPYEHKGCKPYEYKGCEPYEYCEM